MLPDVPGVFVLNLDRVLRRCGGDVGRRCGAVDRPAETGAVQPRQVAAVVDVRVRQNDRVELRRIAAEALVLMPRIDAVSLEQSAVEQNPQVRGFEQMLAAGDLAGGPQEGDFHWPLARTMRIGCSALIKVAHSSLQMLGDFTAVGSVGGFGVSVGTGTGTSSAEKTSECTTSMIAPVTRNESAKLKTGKL